MIRDRSRSPFPRARRHRSLARRALLNTTRGLSILALALLAGACPDAPADTGSPAVVAPSPDARIEELIAILTPLEETVTSDVSDARLIRGRELEGELSAGGREVGLAALEALKHVHERQSLRGKGERVIAVERGLLTVAARAAPEDTRPLLRALSTEYGAALDLRTEAMLLWAETSPEEALEALEPIVVQSRQSKTSPPQEFVVKAFVIACEKTGRSPVQALATVATDLFQEGAARVRAVKELGRHTDPLAQQALQTILVESTGDGYLRRMATQSILASLPAESACAIFAKVADKEADMNFLRFLADVLEKNCAN